MDLTGYHGKMNYKEKVPSFLVFGYKHKTSDYKGRLILCEGRRALTILRQMRFLCKNLLLHEFVLEKKKKT